RRARRGGAELVGRLLRRGRWLRDRRPRMDTDRARRFSMIRDFHLADFITLANGFAGTGAVLCFMHFLVTHRPGHFWLGVALLPVALGLDVLDGRVARWRREASPLGQEMDSLA